MIGSLVLIVAMLVVFPVGLFLSGAVVAAVHGWLATEDAKARHEGSELLELSEKG